MPDHRESAELWVDLFLGEERVEVLSAGRNRRGDWEARLSIQFDLLHIDGRVIRFDGTAIVKGHQQGRDARAHPRED